jgi:hypothetical protein
MDRADHIRGAELRFEQRDSTLRDARTGAGARQWIDDRDNVGGSHARAML